MVVRGAGHIRKFLGSLRSFHTPRDSYGIYTRHGHREEDGERKSQQKEKRVKKHFDSSSTIYHLRTFSKQAEEKMGRLGLTLKSCQETTHHKALGKRMAGLRQYIYISYIGLEHPRLGSVSTDIKAPSYHTLPFTLLWAGLASLQSGRRCCIHLWQRYEARQQMVFRTPRRQHT